MLNVTLKLYYRDLLKNAIFFLPSGFIFQQDGAPAHTAKLAQEWFATNYADVNPLDYHV